MDSAATMLTCGATPFPTDIDHGAAVLTVSKVASDAMDMERSRARPRATSSVYSEKEFSWAT